MKKLISENLPAVCKVAGIEQKDFRKRSYRACHARRLMAEILRQAGFTGTEIAGELKMSLGYIYGRACLIGGKR